MKTLHNIVVGLTIAALLTCLTGCDQSKSEKKLSFKKYSNLKLGFTTQNFIKSTSVTPENLIKLIDYAKKEGYCWIELRDPNAVLTLEECKDLSEYAKNKGIKIAYTIQRGILDNDFEEVFERGVKNAAVFDGPKTIRAITGVQEFEKDENKKGWTEQELEELVKKANKAATLAEQNGLQLVLENAYSALKGDGKTYYGISDFFAKTNKNVHWQFDTGNFFTAPKVDITSSQAQEFLLNNIGKLHYIHLKTAQKRQAQDVLGDNELDFDIIFDVMSKNNVSYVAIELNALEDIKQVYQNLQKSIKYLKNKGFVIEQ